MAVISGGRIMPSDASGPPLQKAGALVANDFADGLTVGRQAVATTTGVVYVCTATNGSTTATWVVVGAQV